MAYSHLQDIKNQIKVQSRLISFNEKHGMGNNTQIHKQRKTKLEKYLADEKVKINNRNITRNKQLKQLRGEIL